MAEKPQAEEAVVPDTTGLMQAIQEGTATEAQLRAVRAGLRLCPICGEYRGDADPCPSCGMH